MLLLAVSFEASAGGSRDGQLRLLYTSSLNGNLDGCACGSTPRSGLVKRAAYVRAKASPEDLLLEIGDIFNPYPDELLAGHICETYLDLGYAAMALGDQELSAGIDTVLQLRGQYPLLCNNLRMLGSDGEWRAFSVGPMVVERAGRSVGIVAVVDPAVCVLYPEHITARLDIDDPASCARSLAEELGSIGVQVVVLLYHGPVESAERLAREVTNIDVLLVGHEQRLMAPHRVGSAIVASPGADGNRIGILTLRMGSQGDADFSAEWVELSYITDPDDPQVRQRIESYKAELRSRTKRSK